MKEARNSLVIMVLVSVVYGVVFYFLHNQTVASIVAATVATVFCWKIDDGEKPIAATFAVFAALMPQLTLLILGVLLILLPLFALVTLELPDINWKVF